MCDCEYPEFFTTKIRTARKTHKCCECSRVINPRDKYDYSSGKRDGYVGSYKTCLECSELKIWLDKKTDCCVAFGELWTELIEAGVLDRFEERIRDEEGFLLETINHPWFVSKEYADEIEMVDEFVRLSK